MAKKRAEPPQQLTPLDLAQMLLNAARVGQARAEAELAAMKVVHAETQAAINRLTLERKSAEDYAAAEAARVAANNNLGAEHAAARLLAADVASRYAVDWQTATFDALTGQIVRLPEETKP